jgi:hypothetical protein
MPELLSQSPCCLLIGERTLRLGIRAAAAQSRKKREFTVPGGPSILTRNRWNGTPSRSLVSGAGREISRVLRPGNKSHAIVGSQKGTGMSHVKNAARIEAIRKTVEQMNRHAVCYMTRIPRHALPEGQVLVHNNVMPQPKIPQRGFRA